MTAVCVPEIVNTQPLRSFSNLSVRYIADSIESPLFQQSNISPHCEVLFLYSIFSMFSFLLLDTATPIFIEGQRHSILPASNARGLAWMRSNHSGSLD